MRGLNIRRAFADWKSSFCAIAAACCSSAGDSLHAASPENVVSLRVKVSAVVAPRLGAVPRQTSRAVVPLVGSSGFANDEPSARP